ncbi:MAG TPA: phosphoribosyl-AMP cyclohydrolase, partial [Candidatus Desulfofervidus auxilii]|nr:phosphoribosyl-AMP cyclohydrolase [Candidatus Desulfofervidus auxilii]
GSSGHIQKVKEIFVDCDNDTLLLKVEQIGAACHKGYRSCFYRKLENGRLKIMSKKAFNPEEVYKNE